MRWGRWGTGPTLKGEMIHFCCERGVSVGAPHLPIFNTFLTSATLPLKRETGPQFQGRGSS